MGRVNWPLRSAYSESFPLLLWRICTFAFERQGFAFAPFSGSIAVAAKGDSRGWGWGWDSPAFFCVWVFSGFWPSCNACAGISFQGVSVSPFGVSFFFRILDEGGLEGGFGCLGTGIPLVFFVKFVFNGLLSSSSTSWLGIVGF